MSNMREISAQMKAIAAVVRDHVAKAFSVLSGRLDSLELQIKGLPAPKDGTSVTIDDVRPLVEEAVKAIPTPKDGKDADPDAIKRMVDEAIALIPVPKDGHSVTVDDVRPVVDDAVRAAVDALPVPKDGRDYDLEVLHAAVKDVVSESIKAIPAPKDGNSVTIVDVQPLITDEVVKAVAAIPKPKDIDPDSVKQLIADAVALIPAPKDGTSVTIDDVRPLVEEAVKAIPAPKDGKSVPVEQVQEMIEKAVSEAVSKAVSTLPKPADGRDACDIEILPAIDTDKSYARGTYATHAGGLWRAYQATDGMKGWDCIVDGIAEHRVEADGERNFAVVLVRSSGAQDRKELIVPAVIDRGVHSAERDYEAGDAVTWAGSLWISQKDSPTGRPGEAGSDGWRLAVKRGRDGKDGRNGIDKTAPVKLEPPK